MKISESTLENIKHIPLQDRVHIYDASIVIEFLNATFMPTAYCLTVGALSKAIAGYKLMPGDLTDSIKGKEDLYISIGKLYEYYSAYRKTKDYTRKIESRYKFSIIMKHLNFNKNGWYLNVKRIGRAQIIYVGPLVFRASVPQIDKERYPVGAARAPTPVDPTLSP